MIKKYILLLTFIAMWFIQYNNAKAYDTYKYGDEIKFNGNTYYVLEESDSNQDYIYLIKGEALTVKELQKYGKDENGNLFIDKYIDKSDDEEFKNYIRFYTSETCAIKCNEYVGTECHSPEYITSGCTNNYDQSDIKKILENWKNDNFYDEELKIIDGYSVKLLTYDEIINDLHYELTFHESTGGYDGYTDYSRTDNTINIDSLDELSWTMSKADDKMKLYTISYKVNSTDVIESASVVPTIYLKKCALNKSCGKNSYQNFYKGQTINFRGSSYYVMEDSSGKQNYIYLLKAKELSLADIKKYGKDEKGEYFVNNYAEYDSYKNLEYNKISFKSDENCRRICESVDLYGNCTNEQIVTNGCATNYNDSDVKRLLDNWKNDNFSDGELQVINGYDVKLLSLDDLDSTFGLTKFTYTDYNNEEEIRYKLKSNTNSLFLNENVWTMNSVDNNSYTIGYSYETGEMIVYPVKKYSYEGVKPTIYLNKCALDDTCNQNNDYKRYNVGQIINFRGNNYYVMETSDNKQDYVKLIRTSILNLVEIQKYGHLYQNKYNALSYFSDYKCNYNDRSECYTSYNQSDIKMVLDSWINDNFYDGELKNIDGYKVRLATEDELVNNLFYEDGHFYNDEYKLYRYSAYTYSDFIIRYDSWSMTSFQKYPNNVLAYGQNVFGSLTYDYKYARPVINLNKCALEGNCLLNKSQELSAGQEVVYNGQKYHVLKTSDNKSNYVTLLKDEPLTEQEIKKYYDGDVTIKNGIANIKFTNQSDNAYNHSIIKNILNKWLKDEFIANNDENSEIPLVKLLSTEDLVEYLGYEWGTGADATAFAYTVTDRTPSWYKHNYSFWLSTPYEDSSYETWIVSETKFTDKNNSYSDLNAIRPVVNVDKCLINPEYEECTKCKYKGQKQEVITYKEFSVGDNINYKGELYYVVKNSDKNTPYIELLKFYPLHYDQINEYGKDANGNSVVNNYIYVREEDLNNDNFDPDVKNFDLYYSQNEQKYKTGTCTKLYNNYLCDGENISTSVYHYSYSAISPGRAEVFPYNYGGMLYYTSETCGSFNGTEVIDRNEEECEIYKNYDLSNVKVVVDNWQKDNFKDDDLMEVDGYKVRLLKYSEYHDAKYNLNLNTSFYKDVFDKYQYWLMDAYNNGYATNYTGTYPIDYYFKFGIQNLTVRPIIFLKKESLTDGVLKSTFNLASCTEIKDDEIENPNPDPNPPTPEPDNPDDVIQIVDVDNTSKFASNISIIISGILIITGFIIIFSNFYRKKIKS